MSDEYTLRDYQAEAIERILRARDRGVRRQLGVAATGLGKTCIFVALARRLACRTLIVAHRDELIEQAASRVQEWWPDVDIGIVKAARNEVNATVVVASVQTLARSKRIADLLEPTVLELPEFGLVVIDEAHHTAAKSYRDLVHALRCDEDDGPLLLGVTATPDRGDGKGLDDLFDEVTFAYDLRWGIAHEYLSDLRATRVQLAADFAGLKVVHGDYNQGQAGEMLEAADAPNLIVRAWLEHAKGRRTLVFTPTVAVSQAVCEAFQAAGVNAGHVDGTTPIDDRRATLERYSLGGDDVLSNCMVLTEGYDEPRTDCIVVARPTKSRALYTQMVGRGTRRHPDKVDCLVIDVVGVTEVHDLVTAPSLFGIEKPERVWEGEATLTEALREQVEEHAAQGRLLATEVQLFDKVRAGRMSWVKIHAVGQRRRYELSIGKAGLLVLLETEPEHWRAGWREPGGSKRVLIDDVSLELAQGVAEDLCRKLGADRFASTDATWRQQRATPKQRDFARRLGIALPVGCTKGQAKDLIDERLGRLRSARS